MERHARADTSTSIVRRNIEEKGPMSPTNDETAEPTRSGLLAAIGGIAVVVLVGFALSFYARVARGIWRLIVDLFPELSALLTIAMGVIGVLGAIGIVVAGASAAARLGWIHAGRLADQDALASRSPLTAGRDSDEGQVLWAEEADGSDDPDHRPDREGALPAGAALIEAKKLIDRWYVLGPEERAAAVELLALAADDEDVVPF